MAEAKPFASLSSGLLARKGAARPAMKPQGFGQMGGGNLEDLGWNDMGFEPPKPAEAPRDESHDAFGDDVVEHPRSHPTGLTPIQSPVHDQQAEIADRFAAGDDAEVEEPDDTAEVYQPEAPAYEAPAYEAAAYEAEPEEESAFEPEPAPVFRRPVKAAVAAVTPNPAPRRAPKPRSATGAGGKAAFTLRLDPSRHLKLRLACAVDGRSAQQIVTDALDRMLLEMPELDAMAQKANRKG
ncbi:MAG TPA: hypothetical protein VM145_03135 [Sphingomicrobium sp.]|nr:hypothetical protein [Sphingomicrobium sp.]